MENAQSHSETC